jgi:hypothetical protein
MAQQGNISICVLWESEIRQAAKALESVRQFEKVLPPTEERTEEHMQELFALANMALNAAAAALHGAEMDGNALVLSSAPPILPEFKARRRKG